MFVIFCDVITFVHSCRPAAIETQAAHQPLALSLHSTMGYSPSEGSLTLGRMAQTDKRPKPSDESEQTSSSSHTLNSIKCSPMLRPHMRAAVEYHQATTAARFYPWHTCTYPDPSTFAQGRSRSLSLFPRVAISNN